jgi:hypothetical protein
MGFQVVLGTRVKPVSAAEFDGNLRGKVTDVIGKLRIQEEMMRSKRGRTTLVIWQVPKATTYLRPTANRKVECPAFWNLATGPVDQGYGPDCIHCVRVRPLEIALQN